MPPATRTTRRSLRSRRGSPTASSEEVEVSACQVCFGFTSLSTFLKMQNFGVHENVLLSFHKSANRLLTAFSSYLIVSKVIHVNKGTCMLLAITSQFENVTMIDSDCLTTVY